MNLVLFGPPGAGKGTQARLLCENFRLTHLSTGDAIRAAIREETPLGIKAAKTVAEGNLIPDEDVTELVDDFIARHRSETDSFLFDGYPRTVGQIDDLERLLERHTLTTPAVVNLDVPDSELTLRITGRRICAECRRTFNIHLGSLSERDNCTTCHGSAELIERADDKPETVRERLRVYHEQTQPVLDAYEHLGVLSTVTGTGDPMDVFHRIISILSEHY